MKKIGTVFQIIPAMEVGGAEIMVENLSMELLIDGFDVTVISMYDYKSIITERLEKNKIPVIYMNKKKGIDLKIIFKMYKLIKEKKPDIVHTHLYTMPYAITAAFFARVPIRIHTIHSIATKEVGKFKRIINYFFYSFCNVIPVSISPNVKESIIAEYDLSQEQVPMIYNGTNLKKCILKKDYDLGNNIKIIHIGSFKEAKNHVELIESFKIIHDNEPNTVLKLIGSGSLENLVRDTVDKLGLRDCVEFLGLKSNVYPYLNEADIFLLPSLWEGMPISIIEAMGTGLPIVASNVGGIPDMIENNVSGLLVDAHKEKIAEAILKMIKDDNLRERLGVAAQKASLSFSSKKMAREYEGLYKKIEDYHVNNRK